ncbi:MAG: nucleotidyl transferase AbiEii/AbiGii toxin family protein [Verrucomicrobia bacterium]|nr:nucleotidyl transferase AbiEii/AbiGii toxin family protein [Verrucomicrobiota bacterium]
MPLTEFQREILRLLAKNRNPDSYVAGGIVLNQTPATPRFSKDIDVFHDAEAIVAAAATTDAATLKSNEFEVRWFIQEPGFFRADVSKSPHSVKIEWVRDSAFRFFPIEPDPDLGFRLNFWDAAVNKILALVSRSEIRDYLDVLFLHKTKLSLGALCWAAAGKDPGWTPDLILNEAIRTTRYTEADLKRLPLTQPVTLPDLKQEWLTAVALAKELIPKLPARDMGCLYLDANGEPFTPDPSAPNFLRFRRHFGCLKGAWPEFLE